MKKNRKSGFTLVEIMIVVLIIAMLAAIAIPSFVRARQRSRTSTCINNLRQIESAKEQYAMEANLADGDGVAAITWTDYIKSGQPTCPIGNAAYTVDVVGTAPTCPNYDATEHPAQL